MSENVSLKLRNTSSKRIKLILEPWAEEYIIGIGIEVEVIASGKPVNAIEIEYDDDDIVIFGWTDDVVTVLCDGQPLPCDFGNT